MAPDRHREQLARTFDDAAHVAVALGKIVLAELGGAHARARVRLEDAAGSLALVTSDASHLVILCQRTVSYAKKKKRHGERILSARAGQKEVAVITRSSLNAASLPQRARRASAQPVKSVGRRSHAR